MKRDMDLVRAILIEMEKWPAGQRHGEIILDGRSDEEVTAHLGMMVEAGLIEAIDASSNDGEAWIPQRITWEGYEFLDSARSDTIWSIAKQQAISTAGALTFESMKVALKWAVGQAIVGGLNPVEGIHGR